MKIEWKTIDTNFRGEYCFTHARGVITPNGFGLITTQPLLLSGSDVFYGMYMSTTNDFGQTWSELMPSKTLIRRKMSNGKEIAMSDATPMYHKKTGKILLLGHYAMYSNGNAPDGGRPRHTTYAVYDEKVGDFAPFELLQMPADPEDTYYSCGNGSGQSLELDSGELLIPIYYMNKEQAGRALGTNCFTSSVMRCGFDGSKLDFLEIGNALTVSVPRGLGEPSVIMHNEEYFLALRNDVTGYVSKSRDGLNYDEPKELVFDNGENVGNYCTQQHWAEMGGKLYMVYTRKNANNDHVFRHRAPLFIAEFDCEKKCLIKSTEQIAVPNRGARLGNFGVTKLNSGTSLVIASEWMQPVGCEKYGSDNSIFISKITV